ncbi:hypothetical protein HZ994_01850 [Akkermansiaceae bacterium]|nr:hypothetical protein HZ994_01850 [Akkermansiaceae bacterium]
MKRRALKVVFGVLLVGLIAFVATREPKTPALAKWEMQGRLREKGEDRKAREADVALVKGLLREDLSHREFDFTVVVEAVSGKRMMPAKGRASAGRVVAAIQDVMDGLIVKMNAVDSPVKGLRRINEGSRFFEDGLLEGLDAMEGISCGIPHTREGTAQRSGYPDLRISDDATGDVYYLDPKLMERGSVASSLRTFYFEPKDTTLKITEDATHLLIGIEHDGNDGDWEFLGYRLVDLSGLKVRLKAEFQASNKDLYGKASVLEKRGGGGEDGADD